MDEHIRFSCPACGRHLKAKLENAGRTARCSCGTALVVPGSRPAAAEPPVDPARSEPNAARRPAAVPRAAPQAAAAPGQPGGSMLDAFWAISMGASLVVGVLGLLLVGSRSMPLAGMLQFGFFLAVGVFATACTFAPRRVLSNPKIVATVGVSNPNAARAVCAITAFLFWGFGLAVLVAALQDKGKPAPSALRAEGAPGQPGPAAQDKPAEDHPSAAEKEAAQREAARQAAAEKEAAEKEAAEKTAAHPGADVSSEFLDSKAISVVDLAGEWKASKPDAPVESFLLRTDPEGKGHMSAAFALHGDPDKWESVGAFNAEGPVTVTAADGKATLQAGDWRWSIQARSDRKSLRMTLLSAAGGLLGLHGTVTARAVGGVAAGRLSAGDLRGLGRLNLERSSSAAVSDPPSVTMRNEDDAQQKTINVYTVPAAKEFGPCERRYEVEGFGPTAETSKFKRDIPAVGPMPLKLQPDPRGDETAFWVRGPKTLGAEGQVIEIAPIPFVLCGETTGFNDALTAMRSLELANRNAGIAPGAVHRYLIRGRAPRNVFLLYIPKNTDLPGLQRLYPKEKAFEFSEEKALALMAESTLPKDVQGAYIDLLRRGGAVYIPARNGKRIYLTVQPGRVLEKNVVE